MRDKHRCVRYRTSSPRSRYKEPSTCRPCLWVSQRHDVGLVQLFAGFEHVCAGDETPCPRTMMLMQMMLHSASSETVLKQRESSPKMMPCITGLGEAIDAVRALFSSTRALTCFRRATFASCCSLGVVRAPRDCDRSHTKGCGKQRKLRSISPEE
jgi:hypothetical protein